MSDTHVRGEAAATRLRSAVDAVIAEVRQLPPDLITWIPGEGIWSVMDNLCHIREFIPFWTGETLRIVRSPAEAWGRTHTDTARLAAVTNTSGQVLDDVLRDMHRRATESADRLAALTDREFDVEAPSQNPRWGVKPAGFVVDHLIVGHTEKHLGQIRRNVQQFAERNAGGDVTP